jgi:3-methyladenine DNA glycosylase/8-oxoguanine DNA glycosylase
MSGAETETRVEAVCSLEISPHGPFSLALSARGRGDLCRRFRNGVLTQAIELDGRVERVEARQRPDGTVILGGPSKDALALLRFQLALDDDHSAFLRRFGDDPLLGPATRALRGLRPLRLATVAHSLLRALAGQLISSREARAIEARIVRRVSERAPGSRLYAPPSAERLGALAPAELCRLGLAPKRAAALVRLCRTLDLERLRLRDPSSVAARLERERTIGPWSVGVIGLQGLGAYSLGLVGDLGLVKLCAALEGRWVGAAETRLLLERYGDWAGLASVYLLAASARGLIRRPGQPGPVALAARAARAAS